MVNFRGGAPVESLDSEGGAKLASPLACQKEM